MNGIFNVMKKQFIRVNELTEEKIVKHREKITEQIEKRKEELDRYEVEMLETYSGVFTEFLSDEETIKAIFEGVRGSLESLTCLTDKKLILMAKRYDITVIPLKNIKYVSFARDQHYWDLKISTSTKNFKFSMKNCDHCDRYLKIISSCIF